MKKKFTLLELIALVFIVGIVAAFIYPLLFHYNRPREKPRRAHCAGNLKQIGMAMLGYSGDYGGTFPLTPVGNSFEILDENHTNELPSSKVYDCPSQGDYAGLSTNSDYWYLGSGVRDDAKDAEHVMLAYDMFGNHPKNAWMNMLYADGHVDGGKPDPKKGLFDNTHAVRPKE
jgi:prepilin-type processing-associated H-X9-DG protein